MNILFITHEYYPFPSAITNCLNPIINSLKKNNNVFILTRKINDSKKEEIIDNVKIYRVEDDYNTNLKKRDETKNKLFKFYYKTKFHLMYKKQIKSTNDGYFSVNKMIKKGKKIAKNEKIDMIISCSFPFTSHVIASKIKNKSIKWIAYQFDPYTYNYTLLNDGKLNKRLEKEISILSKTDKIFITEENYKENLKTELTKLKSKYIVLPYALIKKPNIDVKTNKNSISLVFAGTLYKDIREPFKMLDILNKTYDSLEIHLYYSAEQYINDLLKEYIKKMPNLIIHYKEKKEVCDIALANTNIVLNIGNIMLNQTPSKVYELISLGKPIINFYTNSEDTSKNILKNYPLCYNVDMNNFTNYDDLKKFIIENKDKIISFEEATKLYLKQNEVVDLIVKEVEKIYEDR